jgi:hypothetical protein
MPVKFKREKIMVVCGKNEQETLEEVSALVYKGLALHKEKHSGRNLIIHVKSGRALTRKTEHLTYYDLRALLVRLADLHDWNQSEEELKKNTDLEKLVMKLFREPRRRVENETQTA